ncbi:MAG: methyltransferase domain-containing protein [Flavobacteriales bacterium]|nr:methyltransferase domain-containing protein [Flavobacteriales bacterium]MBK7555453.1 methyltransferase domain-containing protein [Flavobacteriales bacterium]MBK9196771.1 methyltransferase domain-containing protein [Flavobacteriales bacterium]MBP6574879.1 methyltransferase domain-containing protein [Flavobacteriales bacterium]
MKSALLLVVILASITACETPAPKNTVPVGDPRDNWQRPQEVFSNMGGIQGKIVADLFAGDGYIAFNMLQAGAAKVIAIDTDPANVAHMQSKKEELNIGDDRLEIRQTTPGETGLGPEEVDLTFIFNKYTSIQDRASYMAKVRASTKSPRTVYIIDFLVAETPVGPPIEQRMNDAQMMDELGEFEYSDMGARSNILPYQYILFAQDYVDGAETEVGPLQPQ